MKDPCAPTIVAELPERLDSLLDLLCFGWPLPERVLQQEVIAQLLASRSRDDFVCARALAGGTLVGVVLAQKFPGNTAVVYGPQVTDRSASQLAVHLLQALEQQLRRAGIRLVQSLLAMEDAAAEQLFRRAGYTSAARLLYMACSAADFPHQSSPLEVLLEPATAASERQLEQLIENTYEGTLDCPLLNGLRTTDDVIAGYRAVGTHRPELWFVARDNERDLGCLILADHPEHSNLELVYLGLIPAARGKGIGLRLAKHTLWIARQLGRQRVVLAVDAANAPAIGVYEAAGFFGFDQRQLMIKRL